MSAIRLARAFTKRSLIIKFDGCYHGHADSFLIKAGSGLATLGMASSQGVPAEVANLTISLPYNDLDQVERVLQEHKGKVAAIIVEPVVGNAGLILPVDGFLNGLRELCTANGALLIFDEVMTGFRVAPGGAQGKYQVTPDLTCLGKIIGAGLPVGSYGGKKEIMEMVAPAGPVYQAGTLAGNPIAMAAGVAQLKVLREPGCYARLEELTERFRKGLQAIAEKSKVPIYVASVTGMICVYFNDKPVTDLETAQESNTEAFAKFWRSMLKRDVYWPPSQFESAFLSLVHTQADIDKTVEAARESIALVAGGTDSV